MDVIVHAQKEYKSDTRIPAALWWALVLACDYIIKQNKQVASYSTFFAELKHLDDKVTAESYLKYGNDCEDAIKKGSDPGKVSIEGYYWRWTGCPHIVNLRVQRRSRLLGEIGKNLSALTIVKKRAVT